MAKEQLQQAYALIKQGKKREAVTMIQPIVQADPSNGDALWLLANASDDTGIKRDSLKRILQIGGNEGRLMKAQQMLNSLPPEDDFDDLFGNDDDLDFGASAAPAPKRRPAPSSALEDPYTEENKAKKKKGGGNPCLIIAGVVVVLGILACIGFSLVAYQSLNIFGEAFGDIVDIFTAPTEYTDLGVVEPGQTVTGEVSGANDRLGYRINLQQGDRVTLNIRTVGGEPIAPVVLIYGPDDLLLDGTETEYNSEEDFSQSSTANLSTSVQQSGEHLIVVRPFFTLGIASYELTIE